MSNCGTDINKTIIVEPVVTGGEAITACTSVTTNKVISCSGDSEVILASGYTQFNTNIEPTNDNSISIGKNKRFREINVFSGTTSIWSADTITYTPILDLGVDSQNNLRRITANNSVIENDILNGGDF